MSLPGPGRPHPLLRLVPHAVVVQRSTEELQVGVGAGVVVPLAWAPVLERLAWEVSAEALQQVAGAAGLAPAQTVQLLDALAAAGLLAGPPAADPATGAVRLVGSGPLARRTVTLLAAAGVSACYLADLPGRGPDERLDVLAAGLRRRHPGLPVHRLRHWTKPDDVGVPLTVVAADGPEVDRLVTDTLLAADAAHLVLRSSGDEVSVGPLVVPGSTSCLRCADLARRDADPQWPWVLAQLTHRRLDPAPSLLAWASAVAAAQALGFLSGVSPESAGHTLELSTRDHRTRLRPWPVHPACGCRWSDRTE